MKPNIAEAETFDRLKHRGVYLSQPKLDGVRCLATAAGLRSKNGNAIEAPHIATDLAGRIPDGVVLDGELYKHGVPFSKIAKAVKSGKCADLEFVVFDVFFEGNFTNADYSTRRKYVEQLLAGSEVCRVVPQKEYMVSTIRQLEKEAAGYVASGYEGAIFRRDSHWRAGRHGDIVKLKPVRDAEFCIVSLEKTKTGRLTLILKTDSGETFRCSVGMTADERKALYENRAELSGAPATVEFQELTERGVPRFPRLKEIRDYE